MQEATSPTTSGIDYLERLKPRIRLATSADVDWLWEKARSQSSIFHEPGPHEEQEFKALLMSSDTLGFIVDGGALAFFTSIVPNHRAFLNAIIWDERLYAKYDLAQDIIQFMFDALQLERLDAAIPSDNVLGRNYAEHLGFTLEGRIRRAIVRPDENKYADVLYYGLLKEERDGLGSGSTVRVLGGGELGSEPALGQAGRQGRRTPIASLRGAEAARSDRDRHAPGRHNGSGATVDGGDAGVPQPSWRSRIARAWRSGYAGWHGRNGQPD